MKSLLTGILAGALATTLFAGCSLDVPKHGDPNLNIILDRSAAERPAGTLLEELASLWGGIRLLASGPTSLSDFNCFAVNVTGVGVPSNGATQLQNCSSTSNMRGVGVGLVSNTVPANTPIALQVTSGPARTIDAYGVFPSGICGSGNGGGGSGGGGNGGGGYFLGRVIQDLIADATVTVPLSFSGTPGPDVVCSGGGGSHGGGFNLSGIFPDGGRNTGGFTITLTGSGFLSTSIVTVAGSPCTTQTVIDSGKITCVVPSGTTASNVVVQVDNQNGQTSSVNYFTYASPGPFVAVNVNTQNASLGTVTVGQFSELSMTFQNTGSASATTVTSDPLSAPFSTNVGASTCTFSGTLSSDSSCTFTAKFTPAGVGPASQSLVNYWTAGGPNMMFTGTGQ